MTTTARLPYLHHAGDAYVNGRTVVVYGEPDGGTRRLVAETTGGRRIGSRNVSRSEYAALRTQWEHGTSFPDDARITQRALAFVLDAD